MDRKEFGSLIKALRYNMAWITGAPFTQHDLAQALRVSAKVISNLERGSRVGLESDLLLRLADIFHLTTRERTVFFEAASGLRREAVPRSRLHPDDVRKRVHAVLLCYRLPAFVVDDYCNVIAANALMFHLFPHARELAETAQAEKGGFNLLRAVFSSLSGFAGMVTDNKEKYLLQSIYFFRYVTLIRRGRRVYQQMMSHFMEAPDMQAFRAYYRNAFEQDEDYFYEETPAGFRLADLHLHFYSPPQQAIYTPWGTLHLIAYQPADLTTLDHFSALAHDLPPHVYALAPWPMPADLAEWDD